MSVIEKERIKGYKTFEQTKVTSNWWC